MLSRRRDPRAMVVGQVVALVVVLGALLAACGGAQEPSGAQPSGPRGPSEPGTVRVGAGTGAESGLLAEIYAQGLRLRGVTVERVESAATRGEYLAALETGEIDLVPEYTGGLLRALDPTATATASGPVYDAARAALPPTLTLLRPAAAQSADAVVVTRALADRDGLASVADLAPLCPTSTFGGPPAFVQRADGLEAVTRAYGCDFASVVALDDDDALVALRADRVAAAHLSTTDPATAADDVIVLGDPRSAFVAQNVVPLLATSKIDDERVVEVLDRISAQLDTAVLTDLNRQVAAPDRPAPAEVARSWLSSAGVG